MKLICGLLQLLGTAGNIAMLVCGSLELSGNYDLGINSFGGCIAMIVVSAIFGIIPFLKSLLSGGGE